MVILGIDPGYAIVGWGVIEYYHSHFRVLGYGAITTPADSPFPQRLQTIYNDMCYIFVSFVLVYFIILRIADFEINS